MAPDAWHVIIRYPVLALIDVRNVGALSAQSILIHTDPRNLIRG